MMRRLRRFFVRAWPLLAAIAIIVGAPALLRTTRHGRVAVDAAIYLPDMVLQPDIAIEERLGIALPRPIELITDAPARERIEIEYESRNGPRTIEADIYVPAGGGRRPGVVFSMGAPPLELDNPRLVRIAEDAARNGVVMLVPFSERLDEERIEPEEIDALVAEFRYLQSRPEVEPERVGFFGASVGGSLALVAAADPRIAAEVDHVVSFGGYYDALETFGAIATHRIRYGEVDEEWTPREHSEEVMAEQLINALDDPRERDLLFEWFVRDRPYTDQQLATLSPAARDSAEFLRNEDPDAVDELIARLPAEKIADLDELSPRTSIHRVQAELFIVHDVADPFIPYTESRKLEDVIDNRKNAHFDELRLFEHVEPKLNQRPEVVALDSARLLFRLYQLMLRWD